MHADGRLERGEDEALVGRELDEPPEDAREDEGDDDCDSAPDQPVVPAGQHCDEHQLSLPEREPLPGDVPGQR